METEVCDEMSLRSLPVSENFVCRFVKTLCDGCSTCRIIFHSCCIRGDSDREVRDKSKARDYLALTMVGKCNIEEQL